MKLGGYTIVCFAAVYVFVFRTVNGLSCLHCENIPQPRHCHTVTSCDADEVCVAEQSTSTHLYWLGCVKQSNCLNSVPKGNYTQSGCRECCVTDFCNAESCGEPGYPANRGPICYACSYHDKMHPCSTIDVCSSDEECRSVAWEEFGDHFLTSGCKSRHDCLRPKPFPSEIVGKRDAKQRSSRRVICDQCCTKDLCNFDCFNRNKTVTRDPCFSSPCQHGGTCSSVNENYQCQCISGWTGQNCSVYSDKYGFDCLNILQRGLGYSDGVYTIQLNGTGRLKQVYCDMTTDGGGWTVLQKRFNGSVDFFRNFTDYEYGFGSVKGEFWLGLRYIYLMTSNVTNELRIDLTAANSSTAYEVYQNFYISSSPMYTLNIGTSSGTAGDGISDLNGRPFSTLDKDQGGNKYCTKVDRGGWWYSYCTNANLNGVFITPGTSYHGTSYYTAIIYLPWTGYSSLKSTEIKFRRK